MAWHARVQTIAGDKIRALRHGLTNRPSANNNSTMLGVQCNSDLGFKLEILRFARFGKITDSADYEFRNANLIDWL